MILQKVNRTDKEAIYGVGMNINANTMTLGYPACMEWLATSSLGVAVDQPRTSTLPLFFGIAAENIAADGYGRFQVYGYNASAIVNIGGSSISAGGLGVGVLDSSWSLQTTGYPSDAMNAINSAAPQVVVFENDISGSGYTKVFVRAL